MAAPAFVQAGAGVTIASGSGACTLAGTTAGNTIILQVLQDGTAASAVTLSAISNAENLADTASALTTLAAAQAVGSPTAALQHLYVGRSLGGTVSVTVATTGDDLYYRLYEFSGVAAGPAATVINHFPTQTAAAAIYGAAGTLERQAQSFLAPAGTLAEVRATLVKTGAPTDNLIIEVQTDAGGVPSGTVVGTVVTQLATALTTTATVYTYPCAIALTAGKYWLVARRSGARSTVNFCAWGISNAPAYGDGEWANSASGTWTAFFTSETLFGLTIGAGLSDILENSTAGAIVNGVGTGTTVSDTGVTTTAADRLALQFVAINDDSAVDAFAGTTGGTWAEAVAEFASATGTDGCIQLQTATIASAGTIDGGSDAIVTAGWGVIGLALKPAGPSGTAHTATPADTLALADLLERLRTSARTPADTVALTDQFSRVRTASKAPADTVALTDQLTRTRTVARSVADTVALADSCSPVKTVGGVDHTRNPADTVALSDTAARVRTIDRAAADTVAVTDQLTRTRTAARTLADTVALTDALSRVRTAARTLADPVALADSASPVKTTGAVNHTRNIDDTLAPSAADNFNRANANPLNGNWTNGVLPFITSALKLESNTARLAGDFGSASYNGISISAGDVAATVTSTDMTSAGPWLGIMNGSGQAYLLVVSPVTSFVGIRPTNGSSYGGYLGGAGETLTGTASGDRFMLRYGAGGVMSGWRLPVSTGIWEKIIERTDTTYVGPWFGLLALNNEAAIDVSWDDFAVVGLGVADSLTRTVAYQRTRPDTVALTDNAAPVKTTGAVNHTRNPADTVTVADSFSRTAAYQRTRPDTVALSDTVTAAEADALSISDTVALSDSCSPVKGAVAHSRNLSDTVALSDTLTRTRTVARTIADTLTLTDTLTRVRTAARTIADTVAVADQLARVRTAFRTLADTLALTDNAARARATKRTLTDTVAVTDQVVASVGQGASVADTVALTDSITIELGVSLAHTRTVADTVALTDHVEPELVRGGGLDGYIDFPELGWISKPACGQLTPSGLGRIAPSGRGRIAKTEVGV